MEKTNGDAKQKLRTKRINTRPVAFGHRPT